MLNDRQNRTKKKKRSEKKGKNSGSQSSLTHTVYLTWLAGQRQKKQAATGGGYVRTVIGFVNVTATSTHSSGNF